MNIRPFTWRDIPLLHRYSNQGLYLDSTRALIHGPALISMGAFLPFLGPRTRIYTYRCESNHSTGVPLIGQVTHAKGRSYARLSYLAPENGMELTDLSDLSDYIAAQMGAQGAFHVLADVDESSPVYHLLRRSGFAIYAHQRIWRLDGQSSDEPEAVNWRSSRPIDLIRVRSLYCDVVPGLVQQVEPLPKTNLKGFVYYQNEIINAYIELKYGRYGIWVQPYVHPDAERFERKLEYLLVNLPKRRGRPLYICIRSYQSWLESAVEALGAQPAPRQAVMVRHLTATHRVKQTYPLPAMNGTHAEPTAPFARINKTQFMDISEAEEHS